jgi:hypothetical protein
MIFHPVGMSGGNPIEKIENVDMYVNRAQSFFSPCSNEEYLRFDVGFVAVAHQKISSKDARWRSHLRDRRRAWSR